MITFMESKETLKESEKSLDSQLWQACAGSMVQMPSLNSKVFYFPQGHSEHSSEIADFPNFTRVPPYFPCIVSGITLMADPENDEIFAKIRLAPLTTTELDYDGDGIIWPEDLEKPTPFAKTLTQSDANNGGGFSVPRYCADNIFPRLDYSADPPVQTILAKDVHGETWKFRHIYRGTPRRHLLTTGWSSFVNQKKLVAGDSIVFVQAKNGDLCVGIRRAKRAIGDGPKIQTGWDHGGFSREEGSKLTRNVSTSSIDSRGRVMGKDVMEAVSRAASGREFDVVYYPRASTPEFCVRASSVKAAMQIRWCSGMRFKMAFETEDSSRISWFMGTVSSVQVADPVGWPDSPWRLLRVAWDEPDLLHNVRRVNPWLVELVSNVTAIRLSPFFSPPRKKICLPNNPEFQPDGQIQMPPISGTPFGGGCLLLSNNNTPAGMQGARHDLSLSDHKMQSSLFPLGLYPLDRVPLLPTSGPSSQLTARFQESEKNDNGNAVVPLVLFGKRILTEKQISSSCSSDTVNSSSDGNEDRMGNTSDGSGSARIPSEGLSQSEENGQCQVLIAE